MSKYDILTRLEKVFNGWNRSLLGLPNGAGILREAAGEIVSLRRELAEAKDIALGASKAALLAREEALKEVVTLIDQHVKAERDYRQDTMSAVVFDPTQLFDKIRSLGNC